MKPHSTWVKLLLSLSVSIVIVVIVSSIGLYFTRNSARKNPTTVQAQSLVYRAYIEMELAQYNGADPSKPILLAFDGYVYDVTAGREFYQPGGSYHDLAGKDSSKELHLIGGDIIKRKYPVVGSLVK